MCSVLPQENELDAVQTNSCSCLGHARAVAGAPEERFPADRSMARWAARTSASINGNTNGVRTGAARGVVAWPSGLHGHE